MTNHADSPKKILVSGLRTTICMYHLVAVHVYSYVHEWESLNNMNDMIGWGFKM